MPNVELCVVIPEKWSDLLLDYSGVRALGRYTLLRLPIIGRQRGNAFLYRANLCKLIRQFKPDILHVEQEPRSIVTTQWLFANQGQSKTIIFTWENVAQPYQIPQSWCEQYVIKHADAFIGGNTQSFELLRAKGWRGLTWTLPQIGVDPNVRVNAAVVHMRNQFGFGDDFVVGFVGRLIASKGVGDLLAATANLDRTRLLIVGQGEYRAQITHSHVTFCLPVPHTQIADYFAAMDALVLPSHTTPRWKE